MSFSPRVLHVIPSVSSRRGGPSAAIFPMVRALTEQGARVEIATTNDDGPGVSVVPLHERIFRDGVPVRFFPRFSSPLRAVREYAYSASFGVWLRAHVSDYHVVHVHAIFSYLSSAAMRTARHGAIPYISRPLGQLGRWPLQQSAWRKRIHYALSESRNLRHAAAIHFTSETERSEAEELGLSLPGLVIPHGINLPILLCDAKRRLRSELGLPPEQKLVLFLGRLHPKKGLDFLIPACVSKRISDLTLLLAGAGEPGYEATLGAIIRESGANVMRLGHVSGERKQLLLQGADVFALTSRHENFGLAALEAVAAGTPVLLSDQVALAAEVKSFRWAKIVPLEIEAVRRALHEILTVDPLCSAEELRTFVAQHYSWKTNAAALMELYASIMPRPTNKHP